MNCFTGRSLLLERPALDAATTLTRGQVNEASATEAAVVGDELAITTQRSIATVKDRALSQVLGIFEPVPVLMQSMLAPHHVHGLGMVWVAYRLGALVATLVDESSLVGPDEGAVPREEWTAAVNLNGHVNVLRNEVIVTRLRSIPLGRPPGGELAQALDSLDVGLAILLGQCRPAGTC